MSDSDLTREDIAALAVLLADVRDDVADAAKAFRQAETRESPLARQLEELTILLQRTPTPAKRTRAGRTVGLILAFCGGLAAGWYASGHRHNDVHAQAKLMGRIDTLLVERYDALPASIRESVSGLYTKAGFLPPHQRTSKP